MKQTPSKIDIGSSLENDMSLKSRQQLHDSENHLRYLVQERTAELLEANRLLKKEIRERKEAEKALRKNEEKYRVLFENNPVETVIVDLDARVTGYNPAKIDSGVRLPKIGDIMYHDYAGEHDINMLEELKACIRTGRQKEFPEMVYKGRYLHIRISPFPSGAIITSIDITYSKHVEEEKKGLEKQLRHAQKMEAIGTLAGGIAHDFNNILGSILLNTELALDKIGNRDSDITYSLDQIIKGSHRAKHLVEQILTFSRESEVERVPLKISATVKETLKMLRSVLPTTIMIKQDISDQTGTVLADATQIQQLIINLCQNAAQAMSEKGGVLGVELANKFIDTSSPEPELPFGHYVSLVITDAGSGISPEIKERIFDPFFTTKRPGEGTGLGLSVVHGIVVNHEGGITVSSEKGKGATFEVLLPIIDGSVMFQSGKDTKTVPRGNERILFVDDEEVVVDANKRILKSLGYSVTTATASRHAFDMFKKSPDSFDIVITDMTMPHMTGAELAGELLKIRPDIPIILCTGYSYLITSEKARGMGIKEFLMKPFSRREIAEAIRKILD